MSQDKVAKRGLLNWLRGDATTTVPGHVGSPNSGGGDETVRARVGHQEPSADLFQRFDDEGEIGRGGMSSIRRVHDNNLLRRVAMKVLDPTLAREPLHVQSFLEEAQITAQLDHPNVVPVHEMCVDEEGTHYFTMRLVRGHTLAQWIDNTPHRLGSPESLQESLSIIVKVCDALAFAHSRGVLHCDIKPANIMVGYFGEVYLMDWGLARLSGRAAVDTHTVSVRRDEEMDRLKRRESVTGTPAYMSPEQARGKWSEFDERTDVFALGAVLYHVLTGTPPFFASTVREAVKRAETCDFVPVDQVVQHLLPPGILRIVKRAMERLPADRYQSALDFKNDIDLFLRGGLHFPTRTFPAGTRIVVEGEPGDTAYMIIRGHCRASKTIDGAARDLRLMGPGSVFGETALLSSRPRTATVDAVDEVTAVVVSRDLLNDSLGLDSWLGSFLIALAERFRDVDEQLTRLQEHKAHPGE